MKEKIIVLLIFILTQFHLSAQQEIQFSQYVFNGLTVNPAYAGYKENCYLSAVYRNQWSGFPGTPQTGIISFDGVTKAENKKIGLGAQLSWDKAGVQSVYSAYGSYAFRIQLDKADTRRICLGLAFGVSEYSIDGSNYQPVDQNDPAITSGTAFSPDAKFGIYYYTPNFYLGVSAVNLLSLNLTRKLIFNDSTFTSIVKTPHTYITAGFLYNISDNFKLKPSFMIKDDYLGPTSIDMNLFALLSNRVWVGLSYRNSLNIWNNLKQNVITDNIGTVSGILELYLSELFRIGYSYDYSTNGISNYQNGSHEISLGYMFPNKRDLQHIINPRLF